MYTGDTRGAGTVLLNEFDVSNDNSPDFQMNYYLVNENNEVINHQNIASADDIEP